MSNGLREMISEHSDSGNSTFRLFSFACGWAFRSGAEKITNGL